MVYMNKRVMLWYLLALLLFWAGVFCAADRFPLTYDWPFRSVSSLASHKHNPQGGAYFASALSLSMVLLWPCVVALKRVTRHSTQLRSSMQALQVGLVASALVGVDRLLFRDMSARLPQSHEFVAVIAFVALYIGVFGLLRRLLFHHKRHLLAAVAASLTLLAIAGIHLWFSVGQHGLGQSESSWWATGSALLLSPPFWQWLSVALLWLGFGLLLLLRSGSRER
jgi:hypothetical protein